MKMRLSYLLVLSLVALAGVSLYFSTKAFPLFLARAGIVYDRSVEARPGVPIMVAEAVDGDTVELINGERLRYVGIDTPEEVDKRKPVQCGAREAAARNEELVEGKEITFFPDISTKDKYGRWLGFVYLSDGTFVNEMLVEEGHAFSYPYAPDVSKRAVFAAAQGRARTALRGLWAHCTVTRLSSGREQTNPVP